MISPFFYSVLGLASLSSQVFAQNVPLADLRAQYCASVTQAVEQQVASTTQMRIVLEAALSEGSRILPLGTHLISDEFFSQDAVHSAVIPALNRLRATCHRANLIYCRETEYDYAASRTFSPVSLTSWETGAELTLRSGTVRGISVYDLHVAMLGVTTEGQRLRVALETAAPQALQTTLSRFFNNVSCEGAYDPDHNYTGEPIANCRGQNARGEAVEADLTLSNNLGEIGMGYIRIRQRIEGVLTQIRFDVLNPSLQVKSNPMGLLEVAFIFNGPNGNSASMSSTHFDRARREENFFESNRRYVIESLTPAECLPATE